MADTRIRIAKDKEKLVKALRMSDDNTAPFQSYADVLVFAAALGMKQDRREPIREYSKEIDPIRQDIFYGKDYYQVINLLSLVNTNTPQTLAQDDKAVETKIKIFEEVANAGLEIIEEILKGSTNYSEQLLLFLNMSSSKKTDQNEEFDLTEFL